MENEYGDLNTFIELVASTAGINFLQISSVLEKLGLVLTTVLMAIAGIHNIIVSYLTGITYLENNTANNKKVSGKDKIIKKIKRKIQQHISKPAVKSSAVQYMDTVPKEKSKIVHYILYFVSIILNSANGLLLLLCTAKEICPLFRLVRYLFYYKKPENESPIIFYILFSSLAVCLGITSLYKGRGRTVFSRIIVLGIFILAFSMVSLCYLTYDVLPYSTLKLFPDTNIFSQNSWSVLIFFLGILKNCFSIPRIIASLSEPRGFRKRMLCLSSLLVAASLIIIGSANVLIFGKVTPLFNPDLHILGGDAKTVLDGLRNIPGAGPLLLLKDVGYIFILYGAAYFASYDFFTEAKKYRQFSTIIVLSIFFCVLVFITTIKNCEVLIWAFLIASDLLVTFFSCVFVPFFFHSSKRDWSSSVNLYYRIFKKFTICLLALGFCTSLLAIPVVTGFKTQVIK